MKAKFVIHTSLLSKLAIFLVANLMMMTAAVASSSSPRLAAYYDTFLAICENKVYAWSDFDSPKEIMVGANQVGVGKNNRYVLTNDDNLIYWSKDSAKTVTLMNDVKTFHAGRSGLFVIKENNSLWYFKTKTILGFGEKISGKPEHIADNVLTAAIGDSANYYASQNGALFVKGLSHRGQYGDGKLTSTKQFIQTSDNAVQIAPHTGHTLILKNDGSVWGTGGNIFGPVSHHGYGDKAIRWGVIFKEARAIATGSSHSLAIKQDHSLWAWGRNIGLDPKKIMSNVTAVAAGSSITVAISNNTLLQWGSGNKPKKLMKCS